MIGALAKEAKTRVDAIRGEDKGWRKITKRCKDFLIGRGPKIRKNTQGKEQKVTVIEQLAVSNSTV